MASPFPASAAGYSRRIAIAPFASLTKEDIGGTVSVLPRLMASRLMALAGADVLLLPAGGKSPEEATREAKYPLLLQGTVSKLGKGYSVDTTVTDLSTGKIAGAFFVAAATEDDIIAQLGVLSGEIAEKIFDVQGAIRIVTPAPPVAAPALVPVAPLAIGGIPSAALAAGSRGRFSPRTGPDHAGRRVGPVFLEGRGAVRQDLRRVVRRHHGGLGCRSERPGGRLGKTTLYLYRVKGNDLIPSTRINKPLDHHILSVYAMDIDGDGSGRSSSPIL